MTHSVTFIDPDGTERTVDAEPGASLLQLAFDNGIEGLLGECGGSCSCATCHLYIEAGDDSLLGAKSVMEDELLDAAAADRLPNSRLGCQVRIAAGMSAVTVRVPETQI